MPHTVSESSLPEGCLCQHGPDLWPCSEAGVWTQMYLTVMLAPHFAHFYMVNGVVLFPIQRLDVS